MNKTLYVVVAVDMHFFVWPCHYAKREGRTPMTFAMPKEDAYSERARLEQEYNN